MSKNIIVCCDGTGNEVNSELSNILKLYQIINKNGSQKIYYNPGIGTDGKYLKWNLAKQKISGWFKLATGYGLDKDVLNAYRFLCKHYSSGDKIWLFGFSRGAYTVRVLAALINVVGLLNEEQINLSDYALAAYKRASRDSSSEDSQPSSALSDAWYFSKVAGARKQIQIEFIGVWDTVSSILIPKLSFQLLDFEKLLYTQENIIVKNFRHAIAIDERRRMFQLHKWAEPQKFRQKPFRPESDINQNIKQVWFAGVHGDIGGGYPETESGLSKYPLEWMIKEAESLGLIIIKQNLNQIVYGKERKGSKFKYVAPDSNAKMHNSLTFWWRILEWLPKSLSKTQNKNHNPLFPWYLPLGESRVIPENALIHRSVQIRMKNSNYNPKNLPKHYWFIDS